MLVIALIRRHWREMKALHDVSLLVPKPKKLQLLKYLHLLMHLLM
jgi:hypothetical protein